MPDIEVGACFLNMVYASNFFPLLVALDVPGCDLNETDGREQTALHAATARMRTWSEPHEELSKRTADINYRNHEGMKPLRLVVSAVKVAKGDLLNRVKLLMENRTDLSAANNAGETPIAVCARHLLSALDLDRDDRDDPIFPDGVLELMLSKARWLTEAIPDDVLAVSLPYEVHERRSPREDYDMINAVKHKRSLELAIKDLG